MMTPALSALARQLAASPRWRWLPGMLTDMGRVSEVRTGLIRVFDGAGAMVRSYVGDGWLVGTMPFVRKNGEPGQPRIWESTPNARIPDLSDPVTAAALLVLAREVSGDPGLHVVPVLVNGSAWWWTVVTGRAEPMAHRHHESEVEALAAVILRGGE